MIASFVILSFNRQEELLITIANTKAMIKAINLPAEIIVVENGSSTDISAAVTAHFPEVLLISRKQNIGIAGWNDGFSAASGQYLIVLDDDSHANDGLPDAISFLDAHPQTGILALNVTTGPFTSSTYNWTDKQYIANFIGCGVIIRKELYEQIGGFAEWLYVYSHEWEYGIRCLSAGYDIQYFQDSTVIHRTSAINRSNKRLRIYCTRNHLGIVYKYFKKERSKFLTRVILNNLKPVFFLKFKDAWFNVKGIFQFYQLKKELTYTPVTEEAQDFFAQQCWSTRPVFGFLFKGKRDKKRLTM